MAKRSVVGIDAEYATYDDYLASKEWQGRRRAALERADHRCQLCNGTKHLHVHHRTYERVGDESPNDLTVLCDRCHRHFHDGRRVKPARTPTQHRNIPTWKLIAPEVDRLPYGARIEPGAIATALRLPLGKVRKGLRQMAKRNLIENYHGSFHKRTQLEGEFGALLKTAPQTRPKSRRKAKVRVRHLTPEELRAYEEAAKTRSGG